MRTVPWTLAKGLGNRNMLTSFEGLKFFFIGFLHSLGPKSSTFSSLLVFLGILFLQSNVWAFLLQYRRSNKVGALVLNFSLSSLFKAFLTTC